MKYFLVLVSNWTFCVLAQSMTFKRSFVNPMSWEPFQSVTAVGSMVICAALCSQNNQCSAYQWSQNNGSCQLGSPFGLISSSSQGSIVIYLDMDFDESNQGGASTTVELFSAPTTDDPSTTVPSSDPPNTGGTILTVPTKTTETTKNPIAATTTTISLQDCLQFGGTRCVNRCIYFNFASSQTCTVFTPAKKICSCSEFGTPTTTPHL